MSLQDNPFFQQLMLNPEEVISAKVKAPVQSRRQLADIIVQSYMAWRSQQFQKIEEYKLQLKGEVTEEERESILKASGESIVRWFESLPTEVKMKLKRLAPAETEFYLWLQRNPEFRLQVFSMYKNLLTEEYVQKYYPPVQASDIESWLESLGGEEAKILMAISGYERYQPQSQVSGPPKPLDISQLVIPPKPQPKPSLAEIELSKTEYEAIKPLIPSIGEVTYREPVNLISPIQPSPQAYTPIFPSLSVDWSKVEAEAFKMHLGAEYTAVRDWQHIDKSISQLLAEAPTIPQLEIPKQVLAGALAVGESFLAISPYYPKPITPLGSAIDYLMGKPEGIEYLKEKPAYAIGSLIAEVGLFLGLVKALPKVKVETPAAAKPQLLEEVRIPMGKNAGVVERALTVKVRLGEVTEGAKLEDIIGFTGKTIQARYPGWLSIPEVRVGETIKIGEEMQALVKRGILGEATTLKVTETGLRFTEETLKITSGFAKGEVGSLALEQTLEISKGLSKLERIKLWFTGEAEKTIIEKAFQTSEKAVGETLDVTRTLVSGVIVRGPEAKGEAFKVFVGGGGKALGLDVKQILKTVEAIELKTEVKIPSGIVGEAIRLSPSARPISPGPQTILEEATEVETAKTIELPKIEFKIPIKLPSLSLPKVDVEKTLSLGPQEAGKPKAKASAESILKVEVPEKALTPSLREKPKAKEEISVKSFEDLTPRLSLKTKGGTQTIQIPKIDVKQSFKIPSVKPPSISAPSIPRIPSFNIKWSISTGKTKRKRKYKKKRKYREYVNPFATLDEAVKELNKTLRDLGRGIKF
jgi:hypothetical protein